MSMHTGRQSEPVAQVGGIALRSDSAPVGVPRSVINLPPHFGADGSITDDPTPGSEKTDLRLNLKGQYVLLGPPVRVDHVALAAGAGTIPLLATLTGATRLSLHRHVAVVVSQTGTPSPNVAYLLSTPGGLPLGDQGGLGGIGSPVLAGHAFGAGRNGGSSWLSSDPNLNTIILTAQQALGYTSLVIDWYLFGTILNP